MKDYGITHSDERPLVTDVKENKVFVAENIEEETTFMDTGDGEQVEHHSYKYRLLEYTKDEYIALLQSQLTDTQLAIVELYEEMM